MVVFESGVLQRDRLLSDLAGLAQERLDVSIRRHNAQTHTTQRLFGDLCTCNSKYLHQRNDS